MNSMNESDMMPSNVNRASHTEAIESLESKQNELTLAIADIRDLLRKIDTSISGDAPRGITGVVTRLAKLEEEVGILKRGDFVGSSAYNMTVAQVNAQGRVIEAVQKSIEAHQVVITEYVNNKNRVEGAAGAKDKFVAYTWTFIGAGGLYVLMKMAAVLAPVFGVK